MGDGLYRGFCHILISGDVLVLYLIRPERLNRYIQYKFARSGRFFQPLNIPRGNPQG
jgi:hypothetical protein